MDPITHLALATAVFLIMHFIASTPLRGALVESLGEGAYLGSYAAISFLSLGWMVWAYLHAPFEPLWQVPGLKLWPLWVMPFSLILVASALMTRNPTMVKQEELLKAEEPARGILRITRHPLMWGIALWAGVHLLARGDAGSLIFYGGFLLLALPGSALIDARKADAVGKDWERFAQATSNVPFWAIIEGRNRFRFEEIGWKRVFAGLALYVVLLLLHPFLFGAKPY